MDILFWSGGKDSFLAYEFYKQDYEQDTSLKLLTTFEQNSGVVPHQNIPMEHIHKQAADLGLDLIEVPLPEDCPNEEYLATIQKVLKKQEPPVERLIFGDWQLEDIREWREKNFGEMGYTCLFPIWNKSIHDLLPVLLLQPVKVKITAVEEDLQHLIGVGELYTQGFVRTLPKEINPMGENGEFHTEVIFEDLSKKVV